MAGYNRIIMVGNLTRDPEYKQLASGQAVCRVGLATNRQFKNRQSGNMVQEVCYVDIDVWGPQAESCKQYLQKGSSILVEGRLKFDSWEDSAGQKRSKHSIVADRVTFLGSASASDAVSEVAAAEGSEESTRFAPPTDKEKDLEQQLEQVKTRMQAKPARKAPVKAVEDVAELNFQDQPPFKDELPF